MLDSLVQDSCWEGEMTKDEGLARVGTDAAVGQAGDRRRLPAYRAVVGPCGLCERIRHKARVRSNESHASHATVKWFA